MTRASALLLALGAALALSGCNQGPPDEAPADTSVPQRIARQLEDGTPKPVKPGIGTPLAERVATLGLLNKRNNISQDVLLKPGESRRIGNVIIKLSSCERTLPWETPPEVGAFAQVFVEERSRIEQPLEWRRVFSGWLFRNSPSLNVVQHPVYDVWVKDCAMNFPGEEQPLPDETAPEATPAPATPDDAAKPDGEAARPATPATPGPAEPAAPSNAE
jgi:hypothetical protein